MSCRLSLALLQTTLRISTSLPTIIGRLHATVRRRDKVGVRCIRVATKVFDYRFSIRGRSDATLSAGSVLSRQSARCAPTSSTGAMSQAGPSRYRDRQYDDEHHATPNTSLSLPKHPLPANPLSASSNPPAKSSREPSPLKATRSETWVNPLDALPKDRSRTSSPQKPPRSHTSQRVGSIASLLNGGSSSFTPRQDSGNPIRHRSRERSREGEGSTRRISGGHAEKSWTDDRFDPVKKDASRRDGAAELPSRRKDERDRERDDQSEGGRYSNDRMVERGRRLRVTKLVE